jgi:predicted transcriptional regulator
MNAPMVASPTALKYVSDIVAAYLSKNHLSVGEVPALIRSVHSVVAGLSSGTAPESLALKPAVTIKKSITPQHIVCLEDGKKLKMLKRYLRSRYDLTPDAYRAKWNLPHDYPMVAPNYAALRSGLAKKIGLGKRTTKSKIQSKKRSV